MAAANVFNIEQGKFALALVGASDPGTWQGPGGETLETAVLSDYTTGTGIDFSCQVNSGAINASPNTTPRTTAATFCEPEVTTTSVGVTSYTLDATILQDPHIAAGISRFLFEHDTKLSYFYLGLDEENPPKAIGKVRVIAGSFGGDARTDLTATLSLPIETKPDIEFGDATTSVVVEGGTGAATVTPTGVTPGTPGSFTPGGSTAPANLTALQGMGALGESTVWSSGQYVLLGDSSHAHWDGDSWVTGNAP